jgi:hypothetical protein
MIVYAKDSVGDPPGIHKARQMLKGRLLKGAGKRYPLFAFFFHAKKSDARTRQRWFFTLLNHGLDLIIG